MPATLRDLPNEIHYGIASHFTDKATLSSASRAGIQVWKEIFQALLFSEIFLDPSSMTGLRALAASEPESRRDHLMSLIKTVQIHSLHTYFQQESSLQKEVGGEILKTLTKLSNLTTLCFVFASLNWVMPSLEETRDICNLFQLPKLCRVSMLSFPGSHFPLCILPFSRGIKELSLLDGLANTLHTSNIDPGLFSTLEQHLDALDVKPEPVSLHHLELVGLTPIWQVSRYTRQSGKIQATEVDLHYLDGHLFPDTTPSEILGGLFRYLGGSIKTLRLHAVRNLFSTGPPIAQKDVLMLRQLTNLELSLRFEMTSSEIVIEALNHWVVPFSELQKLEYFTLGLKLCVSPRDPARALSLLTLFKICEILDRRLADSKGLKECIFSVERVNYLEPITHGNECWEYASTACDRMDGREIKKHFRRLTCCGIRVQVSLTGLKPSAIESPYHNLNYVPQ